MLVRVVGGLAASALFSWVQEAGAQTDTDICGTTDGQYSADSVIAACTRLIQAGGLSAANLEAAHNNRGVAYEGKGQHDLAIDDYNQVLQVDPNDANAYYNRGTAYENNGQPDLAIADEDQAIRLDPNSHGAFNTRGVAYSDKGEYDLAIADFSQALRLEPDDAAVLDNRGNAYVYALQYDFAIADLDEAIRLMPNDAGEWGDRCWTRAIVNRAILALQDCNQSLSLRPNDAATLASRGLVYLKLARYDLAIIDYNAALAGDPKSAFPLYGRGLAERNSGDVVKGRRDRAAALKLDPQIEALYRTLGTIPGGVPDAVVDPKASRDITPVSLSAELLKAVEQTPEYRRLLALIEKNQTNGVWLRSDRGIEVAHLQRQLRSDAQGLDFVPAKAGDQAPGARLQYTVRGAKVTDANIRVSDLKTDPQYRSAIVTLIAKTICENGLHGFDWNNAD